jgi:hypothetical protein
LLAWPKGAFARITARLLTLIAAYGVIMAIQRKDWLYHLYPLMFLSGWCLTVFTIYLVGEWQRLKSNIGDRKGAALYLAIYDFVILLWVVATLTVNNMSHEKRMQAQLLAAIERYAAHDYVYPLLFTHNFGSFPIIDSDAIFAGSLLPLWPLPWLILKEGTEAGDPRFQAAQQFIFTHLDEDFTRHPPALVWVNKNTELQNSPLQNADIIAFLSRDAKFAALWTHYRWVGDIKGELPLDAQETNGSKKRPPEIALYQRVQ